MLQSTIRVFYVLLRVLFYLLWTPEATKKPTKASRLAVHVLWNNALFSLTTSLVSFLFFFNRLVSFAFKMTRAVKKCVDSALCCVIRKNPPAPPPSSPPPGYKPHMNPVSMQQLYVTEEGGIQSPLDLHLCSRCCLWAAAAVVVRGDDQVSVSSWAGARNQKNRNVLLWCLVPLCPLIYSQL